jgi:hypothetical protein
MAKGIAILNAATGAVVHKLVNDGNAQLGTGAGSTIQLSGTVKLESLNVPTSAGNRIDAANGSNADNIEKAINGISGSMMQEISDASARRIALNGKVEDLQAAAGLTDTGAASTTTDSTLNGQQLDFSFDHTGQRYISAATSFRDADEKMDAELVKQDEWLDHLEADVNTGPTTLTNDGATTAGSVKYQIQQHVGTLQGDALDTLEELRTSINSDSVAATTMVNDVADAIDELDGIVGRTMNSSLRQAQLDLETERDRRKGSITDDATVPTHLTDGGTQGAIQKKIDQIQASVGLTVAGALVAADKPAERDIALADLVDTMETRQNTLQTSQFDCVGLTVTGVTNMNGHMKFEAADASFNFPVLTATQVMAADGGTGLQNTSAYNGQVFFLNSSDTACATAINAGMIDDFADGMKLYFCENGVWHSSYLLQDS